MHCQVFFLDGRNIGCPLSFPSMEDVADSIKKTYNYRRQAKEYTYD
jgi:hypothetical protein